MQKTVSKWLFGGIKKILFLLVILLFIKTYIIEIVRVSGHSMEPTLIDNDRIVVNKLNYFFYKPSRGDIIILKASETENFVKRVIALPGENIKIENYKIYINSKELKESYLDQLTLDKFGPYTIPANSVFVMGDNRLYSLDSRFYGLRNIKYENIRGKIIYRMFPLKSIGSVR